jgi:hypothetical protein
VGAYPANEARQTVFRLVNQGDAELQIVRVRYTCGGCSVLTLPQKNIPPGKTVDLALALTANANQGKYVKHFYVESNDPVQRFLHLTIEGEAVPLLQVDPGARLDAGRLPAGRAWVQEFNLVSTQPGTVLGKPQLSFNHPATAELQEADGGYRLLLTVTPEAGHGNLQGRIMLPVEAPVGWKPQELSISGRVGTVLQATPAMILLPPTEDATVERTVEVQLLGAADFDRAKLGCPPTDGVTMTVTTGPQGETKATFSFDPAFWVRMAKAGEISIRISYPDVEDAVIRCLPETVNP